MSSFRDIRKNYLTVGADLAMVAAGTTVFACPTKSKGKSKGSLVNVAPGQFVVVDPHTSLAVDDSNITGYANIERLILGVGIDTTGNGLADQLRRPFGDELFGCTLDYVNATAAKCGSPHIRDIFFKCVQPATTYSLKVSINDSQTRSEEPWNRDPHQTISYKTSSGDCDACDVNASCSSLACGLIADWEGSEEAITWDWKSDGGNDSPINIVRLFGGAATSKTYCLTTLADTCLDCNHVAAITEFTFKSVAYPLVNTTNPADGTQTLFGQLELVVDQINAVLEADGEGSAVVTKGVGNCCDWQLHVNTCDSGFAITGLTPCVNEDPSATIFPDVTCGDCSASATASGTITAATALAGDTVTVNGLLYTGVAGAKANNTEFSIDTGDTATATDLAASITNDSRVGTLYDVTAIGAAAVVTLVQTVAGTEGNATTLVSSGGTLAVSGATFTGGLGATTAVVWNCGLRIIVDPVAVPCGCYGPNPLAAYFGRSVNVEPVGEGWASSSTLSQDYQAMELPEGFGAWVHNQEFASNNGGHGRTHDDWTTSRGPKNLPDGNGRVGSVLADCSKSYCQIHIGHKLPHSQYGIDGMSNSVPGVTTIAIDDSATTAISSIETFLAAWLGELGPQCPRIANITCAGPNTVANGRRD